jgi:dTDP-4-dehydrorhamnose 3,5-epimerase
MFVLNNTAISGCYEIQTQIHHDNRGHFVKVFQEDDFFKLGLETNFSEEYYSCSRKGVIRGMHFQTPPADHIKMVYCVQGEAFDVVLDIRIGSPTYGQTATFELSAEKGNCIYIPSGLAHGFCALSELTIMVYKVNSVYSPASDTGILWRSIGVHWPINDPIISIRDAGFQILSDFKSPGGFKFEAQRALKIDETPLRVF